MTDPIPASDSRVRKQPAGPIPLTGVRKTITGNQERPLFLILLGLTALNCLFQTTWFWRFRGHDITMDGINYIGLARHLLDGDYKASVHGYWSPLLSWLIAASSIFTHDLTRVALCLTVASLIVCFPLLYALAFQLWRSRTAAALAVFWFSMARGVMSSAVITIQADFLLAGCTLLYFFCLLVCLRRNTRRDWLLLGTMHAVAFLAKAFAMPWLAITTVLAVVATNRKSLRGAIVSLLLASLAPAIIWLCWGEALKTKYGVFTTGYQLRANLMIDLKRRLAHTDRGDPYELADTSYDKYLVADTWDVVHRFSLANPALASMILRNEVRNVPAAIKEVAILLTPGGLLALVIGIFLLTQNRASYSAEAVFAWLAIISLATLVGAYCMLVFDSRYVLPIVPVLMALASCFLFARKESPQDGLTVSPALRKTALGLLLASWIFFALYWASPFRTVDRNFEQSCFQAADLLRSSQPAGETLVSIGEGPYPDHGVGFEAGVYVAYISGRVVTATNSGLPTGDRVQRLANAVLSRKADAVLIWGKPGDISFLTIVDRIRNAPGASLDRAILDPQLGEVGRVVFFARR